MGYMQIAQKNALLKTDQTDPQAPKKKVAKVQQPVNQVMPAVNPKAAPALPSAKQPVPGTPFAALSDLMAKKNSKGLKG